MLLSEIKSNLINTHFLSEPTNVYDINNVLEDINIHLNLTFEFSEDFNELSDPYKAYYKFLTKDNALILIEHDDKIVFITARKKSLIIYKNLSTDEIQETTFKGLRKILKEYKKNYNELIFNVQSN